MADSGKNAITTYDGDGSTTDFLIGFPYLQPEDIKVEEGAAELLLNTDYTITTDGLTVSFSAAPATGTGNVVLTRRSKSTGDLSAQPGAPIVLIYDPEAGASPSAQALTNAFLQALYYAEEIEDMT